MICDITKHETTTILVQCSAHVWCEHFKPEIKIFCTLEYVMKEKCTNLLYIPED